MTNVQIPSILAITTIAITLLLATSSLMIGEVLHANARAHSSNVAYVTDTSCGSGGVEDNKSSGCSIFTNAITGSALPNHGTYTTPSGNSVKFTDVSVDTINASGLGSLSGYDTVMLYQVCDIARYPNLVKALNTYLSNGLGKVVIYDADGCSKTSTPDYRTFLFPFNSSNPGPGHTNSGNITSVEKERSPAVLTTNVSTGSVSGSDTVGDANTFMSNTGGWCAAVIGTNGNGTNGIQVGYARTANGGLVIYDGQDNWLTNIDIQKRQIDNILDQPFNPDRLPCGVPVTGIKLEPVTATNPAGTSYTVVATVHNKTGNPQAGITVTFTVKSGLNADKTGTAVTNASGHATFTYTTTGGAKTDTILATFKDPAGGTHVSNNVTNTQPKRPLFTFKGPNDPYLLLKVSGAVVGTAILALIILKQLGMIFPKLSTPSSSLHPHTKPSPSVNHSQQYFPDVRIEIRGGLDE